MLYTYGGTPADVLTDSAGNVMPNYPINVRRAGTGELVTALFEADGVTPIGQLRTNATSAAAPGAVRMFKIADVPAIDYEYLDKNGAPVRWYQPARELAEAALSTAQDVQADLAGKLSTSGGTVTGALTVTGPVTTPNLLDAAGARLFVVTGAVGTGAVNDGPRIQAALDAAHTAGGGTVVIPGGYTYGIGAELVVYSNTTIVAYGATLRAIADVGLLRNFVYQVDSYGGYAGNSNITVLGGIWDNNAWDGTTGAASGLLDTMNFIHGSNIKVMDATLRNVSSAHAMEFNAVDGGGAWRCRFEGFRDNTVAQNRGTSEAIQIDLTVSGSSSIPAYDNTPARDITIEDCWFGPSARLGSFGRAVGSHMTRAGVYYDDIRVRNCVIQGTRAQGIHAYAWRRSTIEGCHISGSGLAGILATVPEPVAAGYVLTPDSLHIRNNTVRAAGGESGVQVTGFATARYTGVRISGNTVTGITGNGIAAQYCTAPQVTANAVDTTTSVGIVVQYSDGCHIADCHVAATGSNAFNLTACTGGTITGCTVTGTATNHGVVVGDAGDALISGNHIAGAANAGIRLSTTAVRCTVTNNKIRKQGGTVTTVNGISVASTATGAIIAGNDLSGNAWTAAVALVVTGAGAVLDWAGGTTSPGHNRI